MKKAFLVLGAILLNVLVYAQNNAIQGKLLDASLNNEPITFGYVTIKETKQTVSTDFRGSYCFKNLLAGSYTLDFSFLGYITCTKQIVISENEKLKLNAFIKQSDAINVEELILTSAIN